MGFVESFGLREWSSARNGDCNCKVMILYLEIISEDKLPCNNVGEKVALVSD